MSKKLFILKKNDGTPRRFLRPKVKTSQSASPVDEQVPRITNESVTIHREEVLSGARKFIYPLRHSRHKIIVVTSILLTLAVIGFSSFVILNLYKWQNSSSFMYQVTKVVPLPIARIGGTMVPYESYLFELRHYIHYFETQQEVDFTSDQGKAQLTEQRKKSLENAVNYAYVKKIARQKNISVSNAEVEARINLLRSQNKLGSDDKVFEDVLKDYWGWTVSDFKRSIEQEILTSKVVHALDTVVKTKANSIIADIKAGKDFATLAKQFSDDTATKEKGGEMGFLISKTDNNIPPQTIEAVYKLKAGEVSGIIDLGYGLEIIKSIEIQGDKIKAAHILIAYKEIDSYLNDYKEKQKAHIYIRVE